MHITSESGKEDDNIDDRPTKWMAQKKKNVV